jgi:class 3 adenylate cyclase/tetratricopeptide (TPR) repeat protein
MKCPRCQAENPAGMRFCGQCAAPLAAVCSSCGAANPPGHKFCGQCATPLDGSKGPRFAAPDAYTPKHLAERIINSKAALEGERKQVTVLFADLKGSMELLADRDPEEARKILDPVLELMMDAVHRYEGTVNQVMGDGIMALFGAPLAHEDHAVRACYAALKMQEAVKRHSEEVCRVTGVPVLIRVGLNSGEVVVRAMGSDLRVDYTAVGQTTHLAARIEQLADPGSILLAPETLSLAEGWVTVAPLGPITIKGLDRPLSVFRLLGTSAVRSQLEARTGRGLTRFVGRDAEMEQLRHAAGQACEEHGQLVVLVGEPGVGKSRILHEFSRAQRTRGWLVLDSASHSYGQATAYLPVVGLLKDYFKIDRRDDARMISEKVTARLKILNQPLGSTLSPLLGLLDVPVDDIQWQSLEPFRRRQVTFEALRRLLLGECKVQPVMLVVQDLHWIDSETQAFLDSLVESLPIARLLLLVSYRPEYQHGWPSTMHYQQIRVEPLPPESVEELLGALLGPEPALQSLKSLLGERTEGNPFFLEESVRTLTEGGSLVGQPGSYRLATDVTTIRVPSTVHTVLAARIDRLAPEDKAVLQMAAVIGKNVPISLLHGISERSEAELHRALSRLEAGDFVFKTRFFPDQEYTFKHALTHEVAYSTLLHERRRRVHAQIVEAIERLCLQPPAEDIERLAHHAFAGEVWDKAFTYCYRAGCKAARSTNRLAVACFERSLLALTHLPETAEVIANSIDVRIDLRYSLLALAEFQRMFDHLREAERLAASHGDQPRLGRVSAYVAEYFWVLGDYGRAIEYSLRASGIAIGLGDVALQALASRGMCFSYHALGDYRKAIGLWRDRGVRGVGGAWLVWCLAELGDFAEGLTTAEEKLPVWFAEAPVDSYDSSVAAAFALGILHLRRGHYPQAIASLEPGLKLCHENDLPIWFGLVAAALGYAYGLAGRLSEAVPLLERAVESDASLKIIGSQSLLVSWLGETYLQAGRRTKALDCASRAFRLSLQHNERGNHAYALQLLGEIGSRFDPADREAAETRYVEALTLATELGMRPLVAHCHLGLGKLYRRTGEREQAQEHLTTATTMYREMGMRYWLEKADVEKALTRK